MKICVVGLGYIGLPTAAMFSSCGCEVVGVDIKQSVVDTLNSGSIHIEEPGLQEMLQRALEKGLFRASTSVESADVFIIAVPTPNRDDFYLSCDLTHVLDACRSILPHVRNGSVVIVESTIAPCSMDDHIKPLFEGHGLIIGQDVFLAHCPERVLPGNILHEMIYNNRIIGGVTSRCAEEAADVYRLFVKGEIFKTDAKTAEMSKCMENTYRDVNIALANELAKICIKLGINVYDVIKLANKHPRVNIHQPGPGVGGHCLAVDPYFIYAKVPELANIIKLARDTNNSMPQYVTEIVADLVSEIDKPKIAVFGVTYKGNVSDTRESPALNVISCLELKGCQLAVYDPHVKAYQNDCEETVLNADLILVLTDHDEFKTMDYSKLASLMRRPMIFDTKNIICKSDNTNGMEVVNFGNVYRYIRLKGEEYEIV